MWPGRGRISPVLTGPAGGGGRGPWGSGGGETAGRRWSALLIGHTSQLTGTWTRLSDQSAIIVLYLYLLSCTCTSCLVLVLLVLDFYFLSCTSTSRNALKFVKISVYHFGHIFPNF